MAIRGQTAVVTEEVIAQYREIEITPVESGNRLAAG